MLEVSDVITILLVIAHDVTQELHMLDVCPLLARVLQDGAAPPAPGLGHVILGQVDAVGALLALDLLGPLQPELELVDLHGQRVDEVVQIVKSWFVTINFIFSNSIVVIIVVIAILINLDFIIRLSFDRGESVISNNVVRILCWIDLNFRLDIFYQWRLKMILKITKPSHLMSTKQTNHLV